MLEKEESIKRQLDESINKVVENVTVQRERRLWAEASRDRLPDALAYLRDELGFDSLCTISGLDSGENYELIYHLACGGVVLNLKTFAPKADPVFSSVTGVFEGATMYELEVANLLGVQIRGIPGGIKYPLPDDWPEGQYPLRKDWKKDMPAPPAEGAGQNG